MKGVSNADQQAVAVTQACYRAFDRAWDKLLERNAQLPITELRQPVEVMCQKGCAACCTYLVDVLDAEAVVLAITIQQAAPEERDEALKRLLAWEHEFTHWLKHNPRPPEVLFTISNERRVARMNPDHLVWRARWQVKRKACPFLNLEDYTCGAHEIRPATCRGHHAARPPAGAPPEVVTPPEGCFTTAEDLQQGRPNIVWQINDQLGEIWTLALSQQLEQRGLRWGPPGQILPIAVLEAGRQRFGWPGPSKEADDVPVLGHARKEAEVHA